MRSAKPPKESLEERPWRLLLWATLVALVCGLIVLGRIPEDYLRNARNKLHLSQASGEFVFVGIDDRSLQDIGRWPWSRGDQAKLIDRVTAAGADRIFVDLIYDSPSSPADDALLQQAFRRSGRVTIADRSDTGNAADVKAAVRPLEIFTRYSKQASISVSYNFQNSVWRVSYAEPVGDKVLPSFGAAMARSGGAPNSSARIDYSIDPNSVPYHSGSTLLTQPLPDLRGKTVLIGVNADQLGDQFWLPGFGRMAGGYIHILAAETIKRGPPRDYGWLLPLALTFIAAAAALRSKSLPARTLILSVSLVGLLAVPVFLEMRLIFVDVVPGLLLITLVAAQLAIWKWRKRGLVNDETGLPNFTAIRGATVASNRGLVVARLHNHAEIAAALSEEDWAEVERQIVARLSTGSPDGIFVGENGTFAWFIAPQAPIGNHLEALHAIFRAPVSVGPRQIDAALSFGVELGTSRKIGKRLASAVLAAEEAWVEGLRWKLHDPAREEEVSWRVSLLGELDTAIDNGEVWLAYQPQYDLRERKIIGAEALARWTHPQKGPISPSEFIAAAENNGRIGKLTDFVLERAIASAATINKQGTQFQVAVNISARLLTDRQLYDRIEKMLRVNGLAPDLLTLELTETASLQDGDSGLATLDALRMLGVRVAIDDYGTGLSTLEYLKKVPANEIKIDQSFVKSMRVNRSDHIMVQSTIALAHSLNRTVVAEGVEDQQCLEELERLGCDIAQGFAIGRPMGVRELIQRLRFRAPRQVA